MLFIRSGSLKGLVKDRPFTAKHILKYPESYDNGFILPCDRGHSIYRNGKNGTEACINTKWCKNGVVGQIQYR